MAPATKSLTMHCISPYTYFRKPAVYLSTNKCAPSVDHIELEDSYFCTAQHHCTWRFSAQLGPVWCQKQEIRTPKHHSHDKQCLDVPPSTAALIPQNWGGISMWRLPATCEIILPIVSWVISVPNPILQAPPDSISQSVIVHAIMNDTRQAGGKKSNSIPEARSLGHWQHHQLTSALLLGQGIMYFLAPL